VKHAYVQHQFAKITAATIFIQEMTFAKVRVCKACLCPASVRQDHRRHHLHPRDDLRQGDSHRHLLMCSRLLPLFKKFDGIKTENDIDHGKEKILRVEKCIKTLRCWRI
jgi:hypothetical protein